jgi:hypothetical protein
VKLPSPLLNTVKLFKNCVISKTSTQFPAFISFLLHFPNLSGSVFFLSYLQLLRNRQLKFCGSRKLFLCFAQLSPSTAFRSSISGLSTKSDTSTLNDIIYYSFPLSKIEHVDFSFFIFYTG